MPIGLVAPAQQGSLQGPLWRAIAVFRFAALAYVGFLIVSNANAHYARPGWAWLALAVMVAWSTLTWWAYGQPRWRRWPFLIADLAVTAALEVSTLWVIGAAAVSTGVPTLAVAWLAAPVLTWSVAGGRRGGVIAAIVLGGVEILVRGATQPTVTGAMLMFLAAISTGYFARLAVETERRMLAVIEREAANRERERLARGIHDSVLQVLAMVARRGAALDGEAGDLARLAGEQEAALRALISSTVPHAGDLRLPAAPTQTDDAIDLRGLVGPLAGRSVTVATPAEPVLLPAPIAVEMARAVGAALDNVARHGGATAKAWVLVEEEDDQVTVTVRDDGVGIPPGRLAEAAAQGRFGVAQSIVGRLADLGGSASIHSEPDEGTEIELRVPRTLRG